MELLLSDEQRLLQDSAARMLASLGGVKRARGLRGKGGGFDRAVLARMGVEGWLGILVPPEHGGLGLGLTELALVLQEAGRALVPEPVGAVAVAAYALSCGNPSAQSLALLERVLSGDAIVMPAIAHGDAAGTVTATAGKLDGACDGVAVAAECDGFLVSLASGGKAALAYVPREAKGLRIETSPTVDGRPFARLTFDRVAAEHAVAAAPHTLYDLALFAAAAELVGAMSAALDLTVEYLKTRKQFGKPIGSFQALQHRAVDDFARIASSRSLLFQIAAQGTGLSSSMASALKAHAGGEALCVTKSAIQMHGAIGFTDEYDVGLYLKRAMWLSAWLGNEAHHRRRYAALMG